MSRTALHLDYKAELNPQQYEAVTAGPGPALVIAGAGSGKTRTLIYRVAWLIENGVSPWSILLLTFTNKAAKEMIERVGVLIPRDIAGLWGGTFHSVGNRILRRHPTAAGLADGFSIMDREDQKAMLDALTKEAGIDTRNNLFPKGDVLGDIFSLAANTGQSIAEVLETRYLDFLDDAERIGMLAAQYTTRKRRANSADFDDLLLLVLEMFEKHPHIAGKYQEQFRHVLVDEYQDTNLLQSRLIDLFAGQHGNVMVVGDDAQSIYSWRGANFRNILGFPNRYPAAKTHRIETNYRSVPQVLEVANAAIRANIDQFKKNLRPARAGTGLKPVVSGFPTTQDQARFVAERIRDLEAGGVALSDIAVLYRAHFHSMELQLALTANGIPFLLTSGLRFFEQAHVKDVTAFLKFVANPQDEISFTRMARLLPGVGAGTAEKFWRTISGRMSGGFSSFGTLLECVKPGARTAAAWRQLRDTLDEIAPGGGPLHPPDMIGSVVKAIYEDYLKINFPAEEHERRGEDLATLASYAGGFEDLHEFLSSLALLTNLDTDEKSARRGRQETGDQVCLTSIHQAKGLEWKVVFVIMLGDGLFPGARSLGTREALEEERRLFYVAVTRAEDQLFLCYPRERSFGGYNPTFYPPSRFLREIPRELFRQWDPEEY